MADAGAGAVASAAPAVVYDVAYFVALLKKVMPGISDTHDKNARGGELVGTSRVMRKYVPRIPRSILDVLHASCPNCFDLA